MMKNFKLLIASAFVLALPSCAKTRGDGIVKQKYVHKYGIEVPSEDWASRGENGKVISTLADGTVVTNQYEQGRLHGETTYTFPHSETIARVELYEGGNLIKETINNENGWPHKEIRFESPGRKVMTVWYESSSPQRKETYDGDYLATGEYYNSNNQLESRVDNGEGLRILRDFYGTHIRNEKIKDGKISLELTYHPNGVLKSETPFVNGCIEGTKQTFLPSGEPFTVESWVGGKQHGLTVIYKNGLVWKEIPYVEGKKEGIEKVFKGGNQVVEELTWFEGKKHGPRRCFIEDVVKTEWYYKDNIMPRPKKDQYITHEND